MARCYRCLDDGFIAQVDGVLTCDCAAGRAHAAGLETEKQRRGRPRTDDQIADVIASQFSSPSIPPRWDDLTDDDWRKVIVALRR